MQNTEAELSHACASATDSPPAETYPYDRELHSRPIQYPYDPSTWLARARAHEALGYPELVVGDCWKATYLCRSLIDSHSPKHGYRLGYRAGFWMIVESEPDTEAQPENWTATQNRLRETEDDALTLQKEFLYPKSGTSGPYLSRQYPWMFDRHQKRDEMILQDINDDLEKCSAPDTFGKPYCVAKQNALDIADTEDVLGVFASKTIPAGRIIFIDQSDVWGCILSDGFVDDILCGDEQKLSWLGMSKEDATSLVDLLHGLSIEDVQRTMLRVRCLRKIVYDRVANPLDHATMSRLKATYHKQHEVDFHLVDDIVIPNRALIMLGIDIFANQDFDTWVLFTVEARINNNCFITPVSSCLGLSYAMLNHSCDPNVTWDVTKSHNSVELRANREISAGEQLFISYNSFATSRPVLERQKSLSRWIDGGCKCERCLKELEELKKTAGNKIGTLDDKPEWDLDDKVVLPEDAGNLPR